MAVFGGIFLLLSGCEINPRQLIGQSRVAIKLWLGAFFLPFVAGLLLPLAFPNIFVGPSGIGIGQTAFILGIAMAVSAVPVVIKIMEELGWSGTVRAQRVVLTAVLCDIMAWTLFFPILPSQGQSPWLFSHWPLLMFFLGLLFVFFWPNLMKKTPFLKTLNQWIIGPLFFIGVGQALNLSQGMNWPQIILIFVIATISKTLGVWLMAKRTNLPNNESIAISLALNARGAMEIVMAKFALSAGVITSDLFLSLVIMALGTSLIIKPIFRLSAGLRPLTKL